MRSLIKTKLTGVQIGAMIILTVVCIVTGCFIGLSIRDAKSYIFDLDVFMNELKQSDGSFVVEAGSIEGEDHYHSTRFSLQKGSQVLGIDYEAESDYSFTVSLDNDNQVTMVMPAGEGTATQILELDWPTDRAYLNFDLPADNSIEIKKVYITSDKLLYTDGIFQMIILVIIYLAGMYIIIRLPVLERDSKIALVCLTVALVIVNLPMYTDIVLDDPGRWKLFNPFEAMTRFGIDTRAQLLRLEAVMYGILDRQCPVIIGPNYLNECGELTFLYPDLFLYPFAVMRLLGASMLMVFRLMNILVNFFTMLSMYFVCVQISQNRMMSVFFTVLYMFEPHRLRVILEKGAATGMGLPYIFVPLCILGVYFIIKEKKQGAFLLAFGMTGIIESHITTVILVMVLLVILFAVFFREMIKEKSIRLSLTLKSILLAAVFNMGTIVIFLYYYLKGINTDSLLWDNWPEYLLGPSALITNEESLFYTVGLIIAVVFIALMRGGSVENRISYALIGYAAAFQIMSSKLFPWEFLMRHFKIIGTFTNYMQKPHRFYTVMASALVLGILFLIKDRPLKGMLRRSCLIIVCCVLVFGTFVKYSDYLSEDPLLYDQLTGDMNTRQNYNYLPVGVNKEMEFSGSASLSDWDSVESLNYYKRGTQADFTYISSAEGVYAEFPLLAYSGYVAEDETKTPLEIIQGECGRIRVYLKGDGIQHELHIDFKVKPVFTILYLLSLGACIASVVYFVIVYYVKGKNTSLE
ncbi:MAG: hypothetical protein K6G03_12395 [Lachnospiraceae bacterium]|nr:hypothetical protein [Lachnospiraceae bacterium]